MSDRHQLIAATLLLALAVHLGSMTLLPCAKLSAQRLSKS